MTDMYRLQNKNTEKPDYIVQYRPDENQGETYIQIWIKHDAFSVSYIKITRIIGDVLQSLLSQRKQP